MFGEAFSFRTSSASSAVARVAEFAVPLESVNAGELLWVVSARPITPTVVVGGVAVAATTGALVGVGHRLGSTGLPFASIAAVPFHQAAVASSARMVATGLVLHAVAILVWTLVCVLLARAFARRDVAAGVVAVSQFTLSWIIAWSSGTGLASVLALGDRIVYAVVLAGALVVGMWFALPAPRESRDRFVV